MLLAEAPPKAQPDRSGRSQVRHLADFAAKLLQRMCHSAACQLKSEAQASVTRRSEGLQQFRIEVGMTAVMHVAFLEGVLQE